MIMKFYIDELAQLHIIVKLWLRQDFKMNMSVHELYIRYKRSCHCDPGLLWPIGGHVVIRSDPSSPLDLGLSRHILT